MFKCKKELKIIMGCKHLRPLKDLMNSPIRKIKIVFKNYIQVWEDRDPFF